jgi:hypothetical protein
MDRFDSLTSHYIKMYNEENVTSTPEKIAIDAAIGLAGTNPATVPASVKPSITDAQKLLELVKQKIKATQSKLSQQKQSI